MNILIPWARPLLLCHSPGTLGTVFKKWHQFQMLCTSLIKTHPFGRQLIATWAQKCWHLSIPSAWRREVEEEKDLYCCDWLSSHCLIYGSFWKLRFHSPEKLVLPEIVMKIIILTFAVGSFTVEYFRWVTANLGCGRRRGAGEGFRERIQESKWDSRQSKLRKHVLAVCGVKSLLLAALPWGESLGNILLL